MTFDIAMSLRFVQGIGEQLRVRNGHGALGKFLQSLNLSVSFPRRAIPRNCKTPGPTIKHSTDRMESTAALRRAFVGDICSEGCEEITEI